jgi:hypothetical protein
MLFGASGPLCPSSKLVNWQLLKTVCGIINADDALGGLQNKRREGREFEDSMA